LQTALREPDLIKRQEALGLRIVTDERLTPAGHRQFVEQEIERWSKVIQESGVTAE